jgi:hypothetical protein
MRIKGSLAKGLFIALALSLIPVSAISAQKVTAGSKCTVNKQKVKYQNKTYTCIKSGKKLIWNKGVAFKKPTPTVSPTPTPSPTPSPTPTQVLPAKYPDAPTSFDDLIANYEGISYAAWSKSSEAIIAASDLAPSFKAVTGPNTTLAFKNPSSAFHLVARLYSGYKSANDFVVLSFSYDDRNWAQEQMRLMQPNSTYQWITSSACATRSTCWGGGFFTDEKANGLLVLTTEILDDNHTSGTLEAHEYTHAVQQNQMRKTQSWPPVGEWPPTWFIEGQALFAQNASIYYQSFDLYTKNRRAVSDGLFRDSTITSQWIQDFFVVSQPSSWFSKYESWRMYDLGGMLVEILTALKGPSSTMELWKLSGTGLNFTEAFEKVYGISFEKALPIISKAIALELGRS